jgi:uncharacterized RDD family membrane protein YckC
MDWFYAQDGQQPGPVSESQLGELASNGVVSPNTPVWRAGMSEWKPFRDAISPGASPVRPCSSCGRGFPASDLAVFGDSAVCAACQPAWVQRLAQGMARATPRGLRYAGFWIRFVAMIIDSIVLDIVQYAILIPLGLASFGASAERSPESSGLVLLFVLALNIGYYVVFWALYGATPGKMALGLKVVRPDGGELSLGQSIGRYFGYMVSSIILGFGFFMAGWDDENRALHDRMCGTRVIRTR